MRYLLLFLLFVCTIIAGCASDSKDHDSNSSFSAYSEISGFIVSDNISSSSWLILFLENITQDQLISWWYKEILPYQTPHIRVFELHEEDLVTLWYPTKLENLYDYRLYLILQDSKPRQAFRGTKDRYNPLPIQYGWKDKSHIYTMKNNDYWTGEKILYKNFQTVIATGVLDFLPSAYSDDLAIQILVPKESEKIVTPKSDWEDSSQSIHITHDSVILLNNREIDRRDYTESDIITLQTFQSNGTLIYEVHESQSSGPYADKNISIMSYKDSNKKIIDTWTGNFLAGNYTFIPTDAGFVIWRSYDEWPNDIVEWRSTITEDIVRTMEQQESEILNRYRLINQKKYQEAYNKIHNPDITYDQFVDQWKNYNLVSVESISNPFVAFDTYEQDKLDNLEDYNTFIPRVFVQRQDGEIWYIDSLLRVIDDKIIVEQPSISVDSNNHTPFIERENIAKLYYHRIANQQFEQAYEMQYSHSQSLEEFARTYRDVLWVAIKQIDDMVYDGDGGATSSSSRGVNWPINLLVDMVSQDSVDRYYIQKEVINGKLKHISSEQTTESCMWWWCAYGYKPLIYLYPEQEQDITVHLPLKWEFIISYPKIGTDQSWKVKAKPDGNLISYDDKREYSYLFREGKFKKPWIIQEWFVVKKEDTISFLQDKLAYLWLTPKEYNEFIVYRWPLMMKNDYNVVSFLTDQYTSQAPLYIQPKPDSMQRVFMVFHGVDNSYTVPLQNLNPWTRSWFSVVEWWWAEL